MRGIKRGMSATLIARLLVEAYNSFPCVQNHLTQTSWGEMPYVTYPRNNYLTFLRSIAASDKGEDERGYLMAARRIEGLM